MAVPILGVPGNHDSRDLMRAAFPEQAYASSSGPLNQLRAVGGLDLVLLDSSVPGQPHGDLDAATLQLQGVVNAGLIEATGAGSMVVDSAVNNTGTLAALGATLTLDAAVTGNGSAVINGGRLDFTSSFSENVNFTGASLKRSFPGNSFTILRIGTRAE